MQQFKIYSKYCAVQGIAKRMKMQKKQYWNLQISCYGVHLSYATNKKNLSVFLELYCEIPGLPLSVFYYAVIQLKIIHQCDISAVCDT